MTRRSSFLLGGLLAGLLFSRAALAADPAPTPEQEAVFRSGLAEYEKGNRANAVATWENLLATLGEGRGFKILYNLGVAYQASGDVTRAIERYRAFVAQVKQRENVGKDLDHRAADASSRLAQLESSHGAVEVRAPRSGPVVLTRVGTGEPRPAGYIVWLAPGSHRIELRVGTQDLDSKQITVEAGKTSVIETSPPEEPPKPVALAPAPTAAATPPPSSGPSPLVWVGVGVTLASVSLPISTFFVAESKRDDASSLSRTSAAYAGAKDTFDTWRTLHYASYAVPVVLAGVTLAYALLSRPSRHPDARTQGARPMLDLSF